MPLEGDHLVLQYIIKLFKKQGRLGQSYRGFGNIMYLNLKYIAKLFEVLIKPYSILQCSQNTQLYRMYSTVYSYNKIAIHFMAQLYDLIYGS